MQFCSPYKKAVTGLLLLICSASLYSQSLLITEFMASNSSTLSDENGSWSDWIEIYNSGSEAVSLQNWSLTDREDRPNLWLFPERTVDAGAYLIVFASGKDRATSSGELHTNFKLSMDGEYLALVDPEGNAVSAFTPGYPEQETDISYALSGDGYGFASTATPGASNNLGKGSSETEPARFSVPGGLYFQPFRLTLSHPDSTVSIIYTLDGSDPSPDNLQAKYFKYRTTYPDDASAPLDLKKCYYRSYQYSGDIAIYNRSQEPDQYNQICTTTDADPQYIPSVPMEKGMVVRAVAVYADGRMSKVVTHSFFVRESAGDWHSLPVVSLAIQPEKLFGYYYVDGIYVAGESYDLWHQQHPGSSEGDGTPANYIYRGSDRERAAHFEYYDAAGERAVLSQDIGIRIHGDLSRKYPQKSLRLYARSEYGESSFEYPFFTDLSSDSFKRIILRNSGNDRVHTFFRDAVLQRVVSHLGLDCQAYQPAVLFINGEYWGIQNVREYLDKYYISKKYNIDEDNIDLLENAVTMVIEGDTCHYRSMEVFVRSSNMNLAENYDRLNELIDLDNYIDYNISEIYMGNTDWPSKNMIYWRKRTDGYAAKAAPGHDGRWRWMINDLDHGFGLYVDHTNDNLSSARYKSKLFNKLVGSSGFFRQDFARRFADLMNTTFIPQRIRTIILEAKAGIEPEYSRHLSRWQGGVEVSRQFANWETDITAMINYAELRPEAMRDQLRTYLGLGADIAVTVDVSCPAAGFVKINSIDILPSTPGLSGTPYPWTGTYYEKMTLSLHAKANPGYRFVGWSDASLPQTAQIEITPGQDFEVEALFEEAGAAGAVVINEIAHSSLSRHSPGDWVELFNQNEEALDLSGWILEEGGHNPACIIPDNTVIRGKSYLVLARDADDFMKVYPEIPVAAVIPFGLSQEGDSLILKSANAVVVDQIKYSCDCCWPVMTCLNHGTLAVVDPEGDNNCPDNWRISLGTGTPGQENLFYDMHPEPAVIANSDFRFDGWKNDWPDYVYPDHMKFWMSDVSDPVVDSPLNYLYVVPHSDYAPEDEVSEGHPYNNTKRSRINGLNEDGISFVNTGRERDAGGAVLGLDTRGTDDLYVSFTAGTVNPNVRNYAIRLQCRVGTEGPFENVTDGQGNIVEYMSNSEAGHYQLIGPVRLPGDLTGQPCVQLLWRYYCVSGDSGPRAELRLDDIRVSATSFNTGVSDDEDTVSLESTTLLQNQPNPFHSETVIQYGLACTEPVVLTVFDIRGRKLRTLVNETKRAGWHSIVWDGTAADGNRVSSGMYFYTLATPSGRQSRKLLLLN